MSPVTEFRFEDEDDELVEKVIRQYYGAIADKMRDNEDFQTISFLYVGSFRPHIHRAKLKLERATDEDRIKTLKNVLKFPNKFKGYKSTLYARDNDGGDE
jgi:hypothetical protein